MVAQYFKRRREFVEIFIVSGSGLGIAVMSAFIKGAIRLVFISNTWCKSKYSWSKNHCAPTNSHTNTIATHKFSLVIWDVESDL